MRALSTMPTRPPSAPWNRYRGMRGAPGAIGRKPLHTATYPSAVAPVVRRRGFFGRLARRATGIRPPLTADQQLRLLQLALNVKLKREGKLPDSIRLSLVEPEAAGAARAPAGPRVTRLFTASGPTTRAR
jgi:hypothetical protein